MRTLMFLLLSVLLLAMPALARAQGMMDEGGYSAEESANLETVMAMFAAFDAGDMDTMLSLLSDDVIWEINGSSELVATHGQWHGHDGFLAWMELLMSEVEFLSFEVVGTWADGDTVFAYCRDSGRALSTGVIVEQQEIMMFTLADGKVVRMLNFDDSAQEYVAFGGGADDGEDADENETEMEDDD
jgi:ketosteroid isomerase-like protein